MRDPTNNTCRSPRFGPHYHSVSTRQLIESIRTRWRIVRTRRRNRRPAYKPHDPSGALTTYRRVIELIQMHEDGYERH